MTEPMDVRYSVIRYVPDAVREERFNVGVVVYDGSSLIAKLLPKSQSARLKALGYASDFTFLRDIERSLNRGRRLEQTHLPAGQEPWAIEDLERASREWGGTVQFSPLRPARLAPTENAVEMLFSKLVPVPTETHRGPTRSTVKRKVRVGLRRLVADRFQDVDDPAKLVHARHRIKGKLDEHVFDFGVANGNPLHLVQTVSFDVENKDALVKELDATKWALRDLRDKPNHVPTSVVAAGSRQSDLKSQASGVLTKLGAQVFEDQHFDEWIEFVDKSIEG